MSKALITIGSMTNHGGVVSECDKTFIINGIAVHLNGMKHFCPKCKTVVSAIASDQTTIVNGRAVVLAGDKTTCGATFLGNQHLVVSQPKSASSSIAILPKLNTAQSPIATKASLDLPNTAMSFAGENKSQPESVFSPDGNRVDNDRLRGALNSVTFGLSEKAFNTLGMESADPQRLASGEKVGMVAATVIGPGKGKIAVESLETAGKSAYEIAKNGGKHAGFLKNNLERTTKELEKGIQSIKNEISEHAALIKNPSEVMSKLGKGDFKSLDPRQQKALVDKKWPSDIARQEQQKNILEGIIKDRGK